MACVLTKFTAMGIAASAALYIALLGLLTISWFQAHAVYLHSIQMTKIKDLNTPEAFGFLRNQVTPFNIQQGGSANLYVWHILPVELYRKHEDLLLAESSGLAKDFTLHTSFRLLHDNPESILVIHMHGAGGTVASGYRTHNYRALTAAASTKLHVLTFDYRGFGRTPGWPCEHGIILDAIAVVDWALHVAHIPPERILIFAQSLGTAISAAIAEHYVQRTPSVVFAGHIHVAGFVDLPTLLSTYKIAGTIPLLGPVAKFPLLFDYLRTFVKDDWSTQRRLHDYVRFNEKHGARYYLALIHAEDDYDIPWQHTHSLFHHLIEATSTNDSSDSDVASRSAALTVDHKAGGRIAEWNTNIGCIRQEIHKHGLHDAIMGSAVVTLAVSRIFGQML